MSPDFFLAIDYFMATTEVAVDNESIIIKTSFYEACNLTLTKTIDSDGDSIVDESDCALLDASKFQNQIGYLDVDGDGHGAGDQATICSAEVLPVNYSSVNTDCDDVDNTTYPGADELVDGKDNYCNGDIDEGLNEIDTDRDGVVDELDCAPNDENYDTEKVWFLDNDNDSYGDPTNMTFACYPPESHTVDDTDCDDSMADINPGATEIINGLDNDCDGSIE